MTITEYRHGRVFSSNGEVKHSESANFSTQLFWKKVHYSKPGPALAIGRAGDCLGPRTLRRGLYNRIIPYLPVHQSSRAEILASLFIGYS